MMATLLRDARDRAEVISMLTASEGSIYRRFGYGIATARVGVTVNRAHVGFVNDFGTEGRHRFVSFDEAADLFPPVYEACRLARAGMVSRPDYWWPEVLFGHSPDAARFTVVHEDSHGVVDAFAFYTVEGTWRGGLSGRKVEVVDLQGATAAGRAAMWRYLLSIDLVEEVTVYNVPLDDPVRWLLTDPRRWRIDFMNDGLYVHLLDVAAALSARTYNADDVLTIGVTDTQGDNGQTVLLETVSGVANCTATTRAPDVVMPIGSLGALYLGGVLPSNLAAAGWIRQCTEGALARADRLFVMPEPPATLSYF